MEWLAYLLFGLVIVGFVVVMLYFVSEKKKGHSILSDEPHLSSKDLVRLYKIQKKAEEKRKAKEARKSL